MSNIPDFTKSELDVVNTRLKKRYGVEIEIQLGDSEIRLEPDHETLTSCPVLIWEHKEASFAILKAGIDRYRCQFYYRNVKQYGTGTYEYNNLVECITSLLHTQADNILKEEKLIP